VAGCLLGAAAGVFCALRDRALDAEALRSSELAFVARDRLREGMPLDQAEQVLVGAWHHAVCADGRAHIFLFGSRDLEASGIVLLRTAPRGGQEVVDGVFFVEHELLDRYDDCSALNLSAARGLWWCVLPRVAVDLAGAVVG
jgi:hypothetical protein